VVVTRARPQADELAGLLEARGATPLVASTIELRPADPEELARAVSGLEEGRFEWLVVTSRAGVEALAEAGLASVAARVAAVGDGTARALLDRGIEADLVPSAYTTEALGEAMPGGTGEVLLARADIAPDGLEAALVAKGWTPVRVDAYRTVLADGLPAEVRQSLAEGQVDALTFTSASTVRGFVAATGDLRTPLPAAVCIGPVTAAEASAAGLRVAGVAEPHTIDGLVAALEAVLGPVPSEERS
jgi:uroporphyrinogen-III synthase